MRGSVSGTASAAMLRYTGKLGYLAIFLGAMTICSILVTWGPTLRKHETDKTLGRAARRENAQLVLLACSGPGPSLPYAILEATSRDCSKFIGTCFFLTTHKWIFLSITGSAGLFGPGLALALLRVSKPRNELNGNGGVVRPVNIASIKT